MSDKFKIKIRTIRKIQYINHLCKYYSYIEDYDRLDLTDENDEGILQEINSIINCKNTENLITWTEAPGSNDINGVLNPCYNCKFHEANEKNKDLQCKTPLPFVSYIRY